MSNADDAVKPQDLGKGSELNVIADFSPFWTTEEGRFQAIELGFWEPATSDFVKASGQGSRSKEKALIIDSPNALPFNITKRYGRINLFTHANEKYVAFSGRIVQGNVLFTSMVGVDNFTKSFSDHALGKVRHLLRHAYAHPLLVIYGCKAGVSPDLLKLLANALGIWVAGFQDAIYYHPWRPIGARVSDRSSIKAPERIRLNVGHPPPDGREKYDWETEDFHNLTPQLWVPPD